MTVARLPPLNPRYLAIVFKRPARQNAAIGNSVESDNASVPGQKQMNKGQKEAQAYQGICRNRDSGSPGVVNRYDLDRSFRFTS
jgi:hypothetical protein